MADSTSTIEQNESSVLGEPARLEVLPARVFRLQLVLTGILAVVGIIARTLIYDISPNFDEAGASAPAMARLLSRFDLGFEPSLAAWYSSMCMLFAAMLLLVIYQVKAPGVRFRKHWLLLALIFTGLTVDEVVMFHETLTAATNSLIGPTSGPLFFAWVIPGAIFVLAVAVFYAPFIWTQCPTIRRLFIVSAFVFVGGAIGIEMIEGVLFEQGALASLQFTLVQAAEESCEMIGVAIFTYALLRLLAGDYGVLNIDFLSKRSVSG